MRKTLFAAGTGLVLLLGASAKDAGTDDYRKQTAEYINDNGKAVAEQAGVDFEDAVSAEPASTAVGTTYSCTARSEADGASWTFAVEITAKNSFTVQSAEPTNGSSSATSTSAPSTTTTA